MSTPVEKITEARAALDTAKGTLVTEAESAVQDALKELFKDESVNTVQWAQKSSEYNDEGMYPGVAGPLVNFEGDKWEWLYDPGFDTQAKNLHTVLDLIGEEVLSDIYGEECTVVVTRSKGGLTIESDYCGY